MISGVLQHLKILESTQTRLVLREQPLLAWLIVTMLGIVALCLLIFQLYVTAVVALVIVAMFLLDAHSHLITFYASANMQRIFQQAKQPAS